MLFFIGLKLYPVADGRHKTANADGFEFVGFGGFIAGQVGTQDIASAVRIENTYRKRPFMVPAFPAGEIKGHVEAVNGWQSIVIQLCIVHR